VAAEAGLQASQKYTLKVERKNGRIRFGSLKGVYGL
jgi:hypothetical protein